MSWIVGGLAMLAALWAITRFYLRGPDLSRFDGGHTSAIGDVLEPSVEHYEVLQLLTRLTDSTKEAARRNRLTSMRVAMDNMGSEADLTDIDLKSTRADGVTAEWVVVKGTNPSRRLLYIHGGAFTMGSPKSHRVITSKLARISGMAVLAIDYRLMPEHKRLEGLADCCTAYRWILDNGPDGPGPVSDLVVAGDSAGGNLTLAVIAWARDEKLRPANAAIALSPATDSAFTGPSMMTNIATDHMLGPMFGKLARLPRALLLWGAFINNRVRPCDPRVSPIYGDLSNLPPTLIHASEAEMLLDDARRYARKATEAGSEVTLETWRHMLHVWHAFEHQLPEAKEAFEHIARFLELNAAPRLERSTGG